jgi:hypothetical protein
MNGLPDTAPKAGDRFPWLRLKFATNGPVEDVFQKASDTQFNLIMIGQPPLPENVLDLDDDHLRVHSIAKDSINDEKLSRAQIPQPSFYLIRPDGYIGLCGTRLETEDLRAYFTQNLGLNASREQHVKERAAVSV